MQRTHLLAVLFVVVAVAGCTDAPTGQAAASAATVGNMHYRPPAGFAAVEEASSSDRAALWSAGTSEPAWIVVTATAHTSSADALLANFEQRWDPRIYLSVVPTARWETDEFQLVTLDGDRWVAANATAVTGAAELDNASIAVYGTADADYIYAVALITERGQLETRYAPFRRTVRNVTIG